jgi:hypothetical protein
MGRRGELGAADELPLGCTKIDQDEVAGGKHVAVRLVGVNAPHPDPQESSGLFAQRRPWRCVPPYEVEKVVRHPRGAYPGHRRVSACAPERCSSSWPPFGNVSRGSGVRYTLSVAHGLARRARDILVVYPGHTWSARAQMDTAAGQARGGPPGRTALTGDGGASPAARAAAEFRSQTRSRDPGREPWWVDRVAPLSPALLHLSAPAALEPTASLLVSRTSSYALQRITAAMR